MATPWLRFLGKPASVMTFVPHVEVTIGRKAPHTPLDAIKKELVREIQTHGSGKVVQRLTREKEILAALLQEQKEHKTVIKECSEAVISRKLEGMSPFGSFWQHQQAIINSSSTLKTRTELAEQIDWLLARQYLIEDEDSLSIEPKNESLMGC